MRKFYAVMLAAMLSQPAAAATFVNGVGGNSGTGSGSRLGVLDRIVICPYGDPDNKGASFIESNGQKFDNCYSVTNHSDRHEFFVPWNTAREWTAFLNAQKHKAQEFEAGRAEQPEITLGTVCPLEGSVTICKDTIYEQTLDANTFNQREVGVLTPFNNPPLGKYAAEGDIFNINITAKDKLTLTCMPDAATGFGRWIVTTAPDGCSSAPAQCAAGSDFSTTKPFLNTDPQPRENTALCTKGNTVKPSDFIMLSDSAWTWTCYGSKGDNIQCAGGLHKQPIDGLCGWYNGKTSPTDLAANYYSNGGQLDKFKKLCDVGLAINFVEEEGRNYHWQCRGVNGGQDSPVCRSSMVIENGLCGLANGASIPTAPNVQSGNMCQSGFAKPTTAQYDAERGVFVWDCVGSNPPNTTNAHCEAVRCHVCQGEDNAFQNFSAVGMVDIAVHGGETCHAQAHAAWVSHGTSRSPELTDSLFIQGGKYEFSFVYSRPADSDLCAPCYKASKEPRNLEITLQGEAGQCGSDPQLNSGEPFTIRR